MDNAQTPVPADHPLMIAWENYKQTEDYANTKKWAASLIVGDCINDEI